jgi:DNA invertase Pin-like site-specific DNA recombinase
MTTYVTYYRVSTKSQSQSGLGLSAQHEGVKQFLRESDRVVASFTEVESGRNCQRPQLTAALAECRRRRATLLIAKLDRLSRNVAFLAKLLEGDVAIVAADNPNATKFTLHVLAAVAEHEAAMISQRTRAALCAAKARGIKLGGNRGRTLSDAERAQGRAVQAAAARERALSLLPIVDEIRATGITTLAGIAFGLTTRGIPTCQGNVWKPMQVSRLLARAAG